MEHCADVAGAVQGEYRLDGIGAEMLAAAGKQFGVVAPDARAIVEHTRNGLVEAFEFVYAQLPQQKAEVVAIVDDLFRGIKQLPLLCNRAPRI
jgi:hypothetical protein